MRALSIALRILRELRRDRRTVALVLFVPAVVMTLLTLIFDGPDYRPQIAVVGVPNYLSEALEKEADVWRMSEDVADYAILQSEVDGILTMENGELTVDVEGSDPSKNGAVLQAVTSMQRAATNAQKVPISYMYGYENMSSMDKFGPIFIGIFIFFFVFLISSMVFFGERTSGTLERVMTTPVYRWEIVLGYLLGFGTLTAVQAVFVSWYAINVLNIMVIGSFSLVLVVTILTAMVALSMGIFLSAFANNELQVVQLVQVLLLPQVFLSGLFDISTMPNWLQLLGRIFPLTYVVDSLRAIMIRGQGWEVVAENVYILLGICAVLFAINTLALKKYRRI